MKIKRLRYFILSLLSFGLIHSCGPNENPDLVNPPSQTETVRVRLLNLAGDKLSRTLVIDWKTQIYDVPFSNVSTALKPAIDSTFPLILASGVKEFQSSMKTKFVRSTNYTFIALPSVKESSNFRNVDTIVTLTTLTGLTETNRTAYVQLFNANNDSTVVYSLTLGCPNGQPIAQNVSYRGASPLVEVRADSIAVSLIRIQYGIPEIVGLYRLTLNKNGQYALIVQKTSSKLEELWLLDMMKESSDAFFKLNPTSERTSNIRVLNFSSQNISVIKAPDEYIANNLISNYVGNYISVNSCISESSDSIFTYVDGNSKSSVALSLDVMQNYSYFVFDSADNIANLSLIAEPIKLNEAVNNRSIVRVVHAGYARKALTVSLGARDDHKSPLGYVAGEVLASNLRYGTVSQPILISSGLAPITIFSATQPAQLLYCTNAYLEPNKSYFLVIMNELQGSIIFDKVALIEDLETDKAIKFLDEGIFAQFVNLTSKIDKVNLAIDGALTNSTIYFAASLATVLNSGNHTIQINGVSKDVYAETGKRLLIISASTYDDIDIIDISNLPLLNSDRYYNRRIINAAKSLPSITVRVDSDSGFIAAEWLQYGSASQSQQVYLERKFSLFFMEPQSYKKTLYTMPDLTFSFAKSYSVIFGTDSSSNGFSAIILQEY